MATLLVTRKMSPALAARVEASVGGYKSQDGSPPARRLRSLIRTALIVAVAFATVSVVTSVRKTRRDREQARAALFRATEVLDSVTESDRQCLTRAEALLSRLAGPEEADHVADELRTPEGLRNVLQRPAVYIRGPLLSFTEATSTHAASAESSKDSLLACLFDPPASRTEKAVLPKANPTSAHLEDLTSNVRRLEEARALLPFLMPEWKHSIAAASDLQEIRALEDRFKKAPIARGMQAMHAELLIAAMDDMSSASGPTELDGARAHNVRLFLAEIRSGTVLLRLTRHVDPKWVSVSLRPTHAHKLDSCVLAMDARDAATARIPSPSPR